jgi:hypothetical protein
MGWCHGGVVAKVHMFFGREAMLGQKNGRAFPCFGDFIHGPWKLAQF